MWQRFTENARRVVFFAQEEAGRLGENSVSTEHLLLGIARGNDNSAARVLDQLGISLGRVRSEVERQVTRGSGRLGQDMRLAPKGKRVIDLAFEEYERLSNKRIGTEHLLLGLIRVDDGLGGRILAKLGVTIEAAREAVVQIQKSDSRPDKPAAGSEQKVAGGKEAIASGHPTIETPGSTIGMWSDWPGGGPIMWQRFTERARRIVFFAQEEAGRLGGNYVSTEHLLLGLLRENDSVAARVLDRIGVPLGRIRSEIERQIEPGEAPPSKDMQLTPRAKRVIDLAYDEARQLNNNYIGTEHLLLGLVREGEGLAGRVLAKLGVTMQQLHEEILKLQDNDSDLQGRFRADYSIHGMRLIKEDPHGWRKRSLVTLFDVSIAQFDDVILVAQGLKALDLERKMLIGWQYPRTLAMLFEKPSLRTRVSFEASMAHLRGHAINLSPSEVGLGSRESVPDVACVLSRWVDIMTARVFKHETVEELAKHATIPVINALSDREHPIQAFADLMTLKEKKGNLGNNLKLAYVGDGNNVLHALLLACAKTGVNISAACPEGYLPDPGYVSEAESIGAETAAVISIQSNPLSAVENADAVYTDVWASMGQEEEKVERAKIFAPYQVNSELMKHAKPDAIVLHCLPAHREEEISSEIMDIHGDTIYEQAENRMHTQKALIALMIGL